jgi:hypothetical protein
MGEGKGEGPGGAVLSGAVVLYGRKPMFSKESDHVDHHEAGE